MCIRDRESAMLSATVLAPDAMTADALATACMAMPPLQAKAMIERLHGTEALIVVADTTAASGWQIMTTPGFPAIK